MKTINFTTPPSAKTIDLFDLLESAVRGQCELQSQISVLRGSITGHVPPTNEEIERYCDTMFYKSKELADIIAKIQEICCKL